MFGGAAARGFRNRIGAYLDAVEAELQLRADVLGARFPSRPALDTLYLGGGTPSLLPVEAVARLIGTVRDRFGLAPDAEITLEANPGPDDRGDLAAFSRAGVNRVSFGAQSLDAGELRRLGRRHAVAEARAAGVASVNIDLLYDVPHGSLETWTTSLERGITLRPDHLSLYALTLDDPDAEGLTGPGGDHLPISPGARRWRAVARTGQDEDRAAAQYHHAVDRLGRDGWHGYEISNWARPGHESRHNLAYWQRRPYEAVGPGAHAFDGAARRWNAASLAGYLGALTPADGPPRLPPGGEEPLDARTSAAERIILGLRTSAGLPAAAAAESPLAEALPWAVAAALVDQGPDGRIVLTTRGRLLSNELFARLLPGPG